MQITAEQLNAVQEFIDKYESSNECRYRPNVDWRAKLAELWFKGQDANYIEDGHLLRQLRNNFGPAWLATFELGDRPMTRRKTVAERGW